MASSCAVERVVKARQIWGRGQKTKKNREEANVKKGYEKERN